MVNVEVVKIVGRVTVFFAMIRGTITVGVQVDTEGRQRTLAFWR